MLLFAALAHADEPLPSPEGMTFASYSIVDPPAPPVPAADVLHGRRYAYERLTSGGSGVTLPDGVSPPFSLNTELLANTPTRELDTLVGFVPGMLPGRSGVLSAEGLAPTLYLDGVRTMGGLPPGRW